MVQACLVGRSGWQGSSNTPPNARGPAVSADAKLLSKRALDVLNALGRYGWASEKYLTRVRSLSPNQIRGGLEELARAGYVSSSFGSNILTARGRRERQRIREERQRVRVRCGNASVHEVSVLADAEIRGAVRRMKPRADRESDAWRLTATFVDPGISEQLDNPNNQIIFGRRGTGKTHVLRVLDDLLSSQRGNLVCYLDLRMLGSNSVFEDVGRPLHLRATSLIKDVFEPIHATLLDRATDPSRAEVDFVPLDDLADAITRSTLSGESRQDEIVKDSATTGSVAAGVTHVPPFINLSARSTRAPSSHHEALARGTRSTTCSSDRSLVRSRARCRARALPTCICSLTSGQPFRRICNLTSRSS
jgi:hypothetical protein